jgi:hypothetical protein
VALQKSTKKTAQRTKIRPTGKKYPEKKAFKIKQKNGFVDVCVLSVLVSEHYESRGTRIGRLITARDV